MWVTSANFDDEQLFYLMSRGVLRPRGPLLGRAQLSAELIQPDWRPRGGRVPHGNRRAELASCNNFSKEYTCRRIKDLHVSVETAEGPKGLKGCQLTDHLAKSTPSWVPTPAVHHGLRPLVTLTTITFR